MQATNNKNKNNHNNNKRLADDNNNNKRLKNNNNGLDGETLCLPFAYLDPAKIPDTLLTTPPLQHLIY